MALSVLVNRARMTVSGTPGTGAITLLAAATGYQTFAAAGVIDANLVSYVIEDGSNWEIGQGTYTATGTTLARTTITASSSGGPAISATSSAQVYLTALAVDFSGIGATVPSGRLTLTTAVPVLTSSVTGATSVIFTPYNGNRAPFWSGSVWQWASFTELSQTLTDTTKSPAAAAASSLYDIFLWSDAGTIRATRGPAWTSATARGSGAGTTELEIVGGYYCNKNAITNGPASGSGLYLGSVATNASSTVDYIFGTSASGGGAARLMVWNNFNRVLTQTTVLDSGVSYTVTTASLQQARLSTNNAIYFISGLAEDGLDVQYFGNISTVAVAGAVGSIAIGLDGIIALLGSNYRIQTVAAFILTGAAPTLSAVTPQLGSHYVTALEKSDGTNANTFDVNSLNSLRLMIRN